MGGMGGSCVILVAGGSGVVGSAIVKRLLRDGADVAAMTAHPERSRARLEAMGARVVVGDVQRPATLPAAVDGAEVVVQALAFPGFPVEKPSKGYTFEEFEHHGTERLVGAAAAAGVRRYVYVSGVGADPNGAESALPGEVGRRAGDRRQPDSRALHHPAVLDVRPRGQRDVAIRHDGAPLAGHPGRRRRPPAAPAGVHRRRRRDVRAGRAARRARRGSSSSAARRS